MKLKWKWGTLKEFLKRQDTPIIKHTHHYRHRHSLLDLLMLLALIIFMAIVHYRVWTALAGALK